MSRTRALTAIAALGAFLVIGIGSAQADNAAGSDNGSNSSVVSNWGSGNVVGSVTGNGNAAQQTATGSGGSNENNTTAVAGNSGGVGALQGNLNFRHEVHYPLVAS
ncbi:hypothetical protein P3T36_003297 [Kitasatospora sp. MAP12-15]|uniref:hypothetical protein n=1 Tax=unclassified Kitasatospora TaxID=2633591 RepID=UPI002473CFF6|nr:hypothetical protein [Kitasatospora sp. MAP12-44]MDH6111273.1 hypothetical protein [Kitasatospora sp. MAP12-44]